MEFDWKKSIRYQCAVTDPNDPNLTERYIAFSKRTSAQVDILLSEGQCILKVHRIGADKDACMINEGHQGSQFFPQFFSGLAYYTSGPIKVFCV